jgi:hypothetical protein
MGSCWAQPYYRNCAMVRETRVCVGGRCMVTLAWDPWFLRIVLTVMSDVTKIDQGACLINY